MNQHRLRAKNAQQEVSAQRELTQICNATLATSLITSQEIHAHYVLLAMNAHLVVASRSAMQVPMLQPDPTNALPAQQAASAKKDSLLQCNATTRILAWLEQLKTIEQQSTYF